MKQKSLTIGFVLDDGLDKPDGVQQYVLGLGGWLRSQGHDVHYLVGETSRKDIKNVHSMAKNIRVSFNGNKLTIPLLSSKKKIKQVLNRYDFDILHVQVPYSPLMGGRIISHASKDTAIVGTFHVLPYGTLASAGSYLLGLVTRWQNKSFARFFAASEPARVFAKDKYRIDSKVVPNFVDVGKYKESAASKDDQLKLIFVSRLVARKGCNHLLKAVKYAKEKSLFNKDLRIDICGDGPQMGELKRYCQNSGLDSVRFHGFVSEKDKIDLLSKADVAVYPSVGGESFGIVLLEAMASGCAVIAGDNPGYRSVLAGAGQSLVDPKNIPEFASRLASAVNSKEFRNDLRAEQKRLLDKFKLSTVGEQVQSEYYRAKHDKLRKTNGYNEQG